jgi:polyhydroxyalkanoate synthase
VIQSLFLALAPFLAERKFVRFAGLDPTSAAAHEFVALEDWLNDGVTLTRGVAQDCLGGWYGLNTPVRGEWRVAGRPVVPGDLGRPALVVLPSRDRLVPPAAAEPLAARLSAAEVLRAPLGHIGMMAASGAPELLWTPIAEWLGARLAGP